MRWRSGWVVLAVCGVSSGAWAGNGADPSAARITGVYFDGYLRGDPEPEEAVRIQNTDPSRVLDLGDFALTDRFGPRRPVRRNARKAMDSEGLMVDDVEAADEDVIDPQMMLVPMTPAATVRVPQGTRIPPGGELWVAHRGDAFQRVFGFPAALEAVDTDPRVPDAFLSPSWVSLPASQGVLALLAPDGRVVDAVAYDSLPGKKKDDTRPLDLAKLPGGAWTGPPVILTDASPYGWTGQILARDRDEAGVPLRDTDTAADWDSGFSRKALGVEPTHRIEFPGQSRFVSRPLRGVKARVTAASAPENQYQLLVDAFASAKQSIRINVYQFTNPILADRLAEALARGIKVTMLMEGVPVAGLPDEERVILDGLGKAGARILFIGERKGQKNAVKPRYRFDHAKYTLIDDRVAIIGTENYGRTGHPVDPSHGNRGFEVAIENPEFVAQLADVFEVDTDPAHQDLVALDEDPTDSYGLPTRDPNYQLSRNVISGLYPERRKALTVDGKVDLELVMSPDTSLNENTAILGMIGRAQRELLVLQNSIPRFWGRGQAASEQTPNLALEKVVEAARRGVMVRVLVDGTWYNAEESDARDNDDTARYLNELAQKEGLNLAAKVINLQTAHLEKIHAKSVMVDGQEVLVSSINWSENSFKGNREMGVIIRHAEVTGYYRELFWRDWRASRLYRVDVRDNDAALLSEPRLGAQVIRRVNRGEWLDVVTEVARGADRGEGFLEVPLEGSMSGYLRANAAGEHLCTSTEARGMYGREVTVEGRVLEVIEKEKVLLLGLDEAERAPFQVVIFKKMREKLTTEQGKDPAALYRGRKVRVHGAVTRFKGPQVEIQNAKQLKTAD